MHTIGRTLHSELDSGRKWKIKETEVHACAVVVGTRDHCVIWTDRQQTRVIQSGAVGNRTEWRIDKLEVKKSINSSMKRWPKMQGNVPRCWRA